ncbi:MAG: DegT/DnrJ/EryC1/StrS family aminotransferase [Chloroflexi bacterium]|nr:DegT/DnrJ/EryC1/StrS family aminotransferase [Chloroflexota bacterium]
MTHENPVSETLPSAAVSPLQLQDVPMSSPDITAVEMRSVYEVLTSPNLSMGSKLPAFEKAFASYIRMKHGVGVNSGTSGLHLAIIASGIGEGDYVITTPFSFIASANCILYERAVPIFVDVDLRTGNIDPDRTAEAVEQIVHDLPGAKCFLPPKLRGRARLAGKAPLKAILPVHTFGQPVDMDPILALAEAYDLTIIEDACEATGSMYKGRKAGSFGKAAVFAFYPNKQMTTGEGGMLVTDNDTWAALFRSLRNQGRDEFNAWLNHVRLGYNYRMDEMSAALGLAQLKRIEELIARRAQVAEWYNLRLRSNELIKIPTVVPTTTRMSWFVYVVRVSPQIDRDGLIRRLKTVGIPSRPYFSPIHLQPFYRERFGYKPGDFPTAEYLGNHSLALPFSSVMKEEQVDYVCRQLLRILAEMAAGSKRVVSRA